MTNKRRGSTLFYRAAWHHGGCVLCPLCDSRTIGAVQVTATPRAHHVSGGRRCLCRVGGLTRAEGADGTAGHTACYVPDPDTLPHSCLPLLRARLLPPRHLTALHPTAPSPPLLFSISPGQRLTSRTSPGCVLFPPRDGSPSRT